MAKTCSARPSLRTKGGFRLLNSFFFHTIANHPATTGNGGSIGAQSVNLKRRTPTSTFASAGVGEAGSKALLLSVIRKQRSSPALSK